MQGKRVDAAGKFGGKQPINRLMPDNAAHAVKPARHQRQSEMRIRRRTAVHMTFVQHFEKFRFELPPQFILQNSLHILSRLPCRNHRC